MNDIVTALSFGAVAVATGAIEEVGRESYQALKNALLRVVAPNSLEKLEQEPESEPRQRVIAEELADAGKADDPDLGALALELIAVVQRSCVGGLTSVSLEDIKAVNIRLGRIAGRDTVVNVKKADLSGDLIVEDISSRAPAPGEAPRR